MKGATLPKLHSRVLICLAWFPMGSRPWANGLNRKTLNSYEVLLRAPNLSSALSLTIKMTPLQDKHGPRASKYSHSWRAVSIGVPTAPVGESGNGACIGTTESGYLVEADASFEVRPRGILFLLLLLYQLWVLESVTSLFLTSTAACVNQRMKHPLQVYGNDGPCKSQALLLLLLLLLLFTVPHPAFGRPIMAGSWGPLAVLSRSSPRLASRRCHRRLKGGKGETHPGILSLTQWYPRIGFSVLSHAPIWQPCLLGLLHIAASPMTSWPRLLLMLLRWTPVQLILLCATSSMSPTPESPASLPLPEIFQWLLFYLFLLIRGTLCAPSIRLHVIYIQ